MEGESPKGDAPASAHVSDAATAQWRECATRRGGGERYARGLLRKAWLARHDVDEAGTVWLA